MTSPERSIIEAQDNIIDDLEKLMGILRAQNDNLQAKVATLQENVAKAEKFAEMLGEPERSTLLCELKGI